MKMKINSSSYKLLIFSFISLIICSFPSLISSQTCKNTCGNTPIKYPFGTGPGCGDPRFLKYVTCNDQKLTLTTHTGSYPITDIDYNNQVIHISDPSMSTCACTQPSKGFGLDWDAPFSFHDDSVFTLLDCSTSNSPIYNTDSEIYDHNNNGTIVPQCDKTGVPICSFLYSCQAISMLNLPISTCCVYTPVDLGPAFEMDLEKLECRSYSGFYSFNGQEVNPENWKYGIALKYKFNVYNDYPSSCGDCERSNGVCGYGGAYNTFVCNCPAAFNTTSDCFFGFSHASSLLMIPFQTGTLWIYSLTWVLIWSFL